MKIAFFANDDFYLWSYRLNLMKRLIADGHVVWAAGAPTNVNYIDALEEAGIFFQPLSLRRGIRPFSAMRYFFQALKFCRREKFDFCHNFSFQSITIASWAQKLTGAKKIFFSITGRGFVYSSQSLLAKILRPIANIGYRSASRLATKIIFQNKTDRQYFEEKKLIKLNQGIFIPGSGVDTDFFSSQDSSFIRQKKRELNIEENQKVVLMVSRLLRSKGVIEFCEIAEILKKNNIEWIFFLVGPIDKVNPEAIDIDEIKKWDEKGVIKYLGERRDIRDLLAVSDLFVFPSYYAEGLPKVILEAMAVGLPVVVAKNAGLVEVVENEKNGFVVPPKNIGKLFRSVEKILNDDILAKKMGQFGRMIVEKDFSDEIIIKKTIEMYFSS